LKWDISRLGAERRRKHSETCEAVSERGGWSPISITQPRGLSFTKTITGFAKKIKSSVISHYCNFTFYLLPQPALLQHPHLPSVIEMGHQPIGC